jgi:hypothetical protein
MKKLATDYKARQAETKKNGLALKLQITNYKLQITKKWSTDYKILKKFV